MNLLVTSEHRFSRAPDGSVWTQASFSYCFWQRYLWVFDHVTVVARIHNVSTVESGWNRADGRSVSFAAVPYYIGPIEYARKLRAIRDATRKALDSNDAVLLRIPSQIATTMASVLYKEQRPYGVEVVGDPHEVFAPGAVNHPLRRYFRWSYTRAMRQQVARAAASAFVTESTLQKRYFPDPNAFSTHYSSVELPPDAFISEAEPSRLEAVSNVLVTIGSLAQMYKGVDVLIEALNICRTNDFDLSLVVIGDGKHRNELEAKAVELGLGDNVKFLGQIASGEAIRMQLDKADLFVLASRTEGLPRALIEAMARGLPCIATSIGGIPEILAEEDLVPTENPSALAGTIMQYIRLPQARKAASKRNLRKAREFQDDLLHVRRREFYLQLWEKTEEWLISRKP